MTYKLGTDITVVKRIEELLKKRPHFLRRCFSEEEILYFQSKKMQPASIAGAYASKEAFSKAIGIGIFSFGFCNVMLGHEESGKPTLVFSERGKRLMAKHGLSFSDLSITHDGEYAFATVLLEQSEGRYDKLFHLPLREKNTHKGNYGRVGIIGGSDGMAGAPFLAAMGALRSGAGLVYNYSPRTIASVLQMKSLENIVIKIAAADSSFGVRCLGELLEKTGNLDAAVVGPGLGRSAELVDFIAEFLKRWKGFLVLDADGLNAVRTPEVFRQCKTVPVLTPHPLEFSRLTNLSVSEVEKNREEAARRFAVQTNTVVLLKGHQTVVADPSGELYINTTGNPGMATAGMGDILSGIIGTFLAQGFPPFEAAKLGAYFHGVAGDLAAREIGEHGMIASDVLHWLPYALK